MTTAVVQLGIVGLPTQKQAAPSSALGAFAKVLDGTIQSSTSPATVANDTTKHSTAPDPGDTASKGNAGVCRNSKQSALDEPGLGIKKSPGRRQEETPLAATTSSAAIIQNTPVVATLGPGSAITIWPASPVNAGNVKVAQVAVNRQQSSENHVDAKSEPNPLAVEQILAGFSTNFEPALQGPTLTGGQKIVKSSNQVSPEIDFKGAGLTFDPKMFVDMREKMKSAGQRQTAQPVVAETVAIEDPKPEVPPAQLRGGEKKTESLETKSAAPNNNSVLPNASTASSSASGVLNTRPTDHLPLPSIARNSAPGPRTEASLSLATTSKDHPSVSDSTKIEVADRQPAAGDSFPLAAGKTEEKAPSPIRKVAEREAPSTAKAATGPAASQPPSNVRAATKTSKDDTGPRGGSGDDGTNLMAKANAQEVLSSKATDQTAIQHSPLETKATVESVPRSGSQLNAVTEQLRSAVHDVDGRETTSPFFSGLVSSAKLIERLGHTEMRVGIQVGELGNVDIRTALSKHQFTAEISVERSDLGQALTTELAGLHNRLAEHRLPFPSVTIQEHGGRSSSNLEQKQRDERKAPQTSFSAAADESSQMAGSGLLSAIAAMDADSASGIDIHM